MCVLIQIVICLTSLFKKFDVDNSGTLSLQEFQQQIGNPYVEAYFRTLDLEIEGEDAKSVFEMLDFDNTGFEMPKGPEAIFFPKFQN